MDNTSSIPSPAEWAGGKEVFEQLTELFYDKVLADPVLEPVFRAMPEFHRKHVAHFLVEVLMGPKLYTEEFGQEGLKRMVGKHIGRKLQENQRKRWVQLLIESADQLHMPSDPEFRSTFIAHLEWGSRIALMNSQLNENPTTSEDHIPKWGWGEVKGPYEIAGSLFRREE